MKYTNVNPIHTVTRDQDGWSTDIGSLRDDGYSLLDVDTYVDFVLCRGADATVVIYGHKYEARDGTKCAVGRTFLRQSAVKVEIHGFGVAQFYGCIGPGSAS